MQNWVIVKQLTEVRTAYLARDMEQVRRWEPRLRTQPEPPARGRLDHALHQVESRA